MSSHVLGAKTINMIIAKYFNDVMDIIPIDKEKIDELSKMSYVEKKENINIIFYNQLNDMCDPFQSDLKQWFDEIFIPFITSNFPEILNPMYIVISHKDKIFLALVANKEKLDGENIRVIFQTGTFFGISDKETSLLDATALNPFMDYVIDYLTELNSIVNTQIFEIEDEPLVEDEITITQLNGEYHCKCGNDDSIVDDPEIGVHCLSCGGRYIRK